jgi:hypothetical protein
MGNTKSSCTKPLAIMAVARNLSLQRCHLVVLRDTLETYADSKGMVEKEWFDQALKRAKILDARDIEIFDLLFTMWDCAGDEKIPYKDFAIGISPLACPRDDVGSILLFALHIGYEKNNGTVNAKEVHDLLQCIDSTASYFGDASLEAFDIDRVVEAVFEKLKPDYAMPHGGKLLFAYA